MIQLHQPYKPRAVRFLELWEHLGWRVKVYGITCEGEHPSPLAVAAGKTIARQQLPLPAVTENRYSIAFLIVHEASDCYWYVLDFWSHENALQHRIYSAPFGAPDQWDDVTTRGPNMCVWELGVMCHERQAWVRHVLANPAGPNLAAYLAQRLNQDL